MFKRYANVFVLIVLLGAGLWSARASANCNFSNGSALGSYTVNLPSTISVPRDAPDTANFAVSGVFSIPGSFWVANCVNANLGVVNARGPNASSPGIVQPIGTTGLGWTWSWTNQPLTTWGIFASGFSGGGGLSGAQHQIGLTRIGTVRPGTVIPAGLLGSFVTGDLTTINVYLGNDVAITALACSTSDVGVPMDTHKASEFSGKNSSAASVGFSISLQNCPTGLNGIKYQVDAAPAVAVVGSPTNGVVSLYTATPAATGVGVQLLDNAENPFPLGTPRTLSYTGANSYTIPLKARYYQTGDTIGPGDANSAMTFTILYQ